jgi:hypothetical protein
MKKKSIILLLISVFPLVVLSQQPDFITEKYFPDPGVKFNTPTLSINENRFATYEEIIKWIDDSIAVYPGARVEIIGKTPMGMGIPVIYLSAGSAAGKIRVWMQGLLHGNEPAGGEALLFLANEILTTEKGAVLLDNMDIAILPVANADGYVEMNRRSAGGFDLNRDQTKFADPVSKIIKKAFIEWQPDVAFDFHEFQPTRKEFSGIGSKGATAFYDVLFLPSGHLNIPKDCEKHQERCFRKRQKKLWKNTVTHIIFILRQIFRKRK